MKTTPGRDPVPYFCTFISVLLCSFAGSVHAQSPPSYVELNRWHFNDTNWLSAFGDAPVSFSNLVNVTNAGNGNSLLLDSTNAAWLRYNTLESYGWTNLTVDRGTVLFWFSPSWSSTNAGGTGPGEWGRLLEVGAYTTNASHGWWSLYVDPAGTNIYFSAQTNGSTATYLSAPIIWTNNTWHYIALSYSSTNSTLYLDKIIATNGLPLTVWPSSNVWAEGFNIGSGSNGLNQAHGMFDDLYAFDRPLDQTTIGTYASFFSIVYSEEPFTPSYIDPAPASPSFAPFNAITGIGFLQYLSNTTACVTSGNIWATNIIATLTTNGTVNVILSFGGGTNGLLYDVFANASLTPSSTIYQWAWMGQGPSCSTYLITNLPMGTAFMLLGQPTDSDLDGLTDAYERLVSKTNPTNPDTDGDGMLDGWEVLWGFNPLSDEATQTGQRSNYTYDLVGWLDTIFGTRTETIGMDAEGNVETAQ